MYRTYVHTNIRSHDSQIRRSSRRLRTNDVAVRPHVTVFTNKSWYGFPRFGRMPGNRTRNPRSVRKRCPVSRVTGRSDVSRRTNYLFSLSPSSSLSTLPPPNILHSFAVPSVRQKSRVKTTVRRTRTIRVACVSETTRYGIAV